MKPSDVEWKLPLRALNNHMELAVQKTEIQESPYGCPTPAWRQNRNIRLERMDGNSRSKKKKKEKEPCHCLKRVARQGPVWTGLIATEV